jgi:hypothetical protein
MIKRIQPLSDGCSYEKRILRMVFGVQQKTRQDLLYIVETFPLTPPTSPPKKSHRLIGNLYNWSP